MSTHPQPPHPGNNPPDNPAAESLRLPAWMATAILIAAIGCAFFYNLGGAPLFDRDEGAFSEATREMFVRGDFISTYLNGEPRFDKPILIYWFQALGVLAFGISEVAFRLPSAVFATLWVLAVFRFVRERFDQETGWFAALLTATSFWVVVIGRAATADALLNCLIVLTLFDIWRYIENGSRGAHLRAFLWAGLGFLAKGPVAVVVPGAAVFLFYLSRRDLKGLARAALNPAGIALFAAVALPWYVANYLKEGQAFIDGFFFKHNVDRFMSPMEGHSGGFVYYIPLMLVIVMPHSSLLIRLLGRWRSALSDEFDRFMWLWFLFVLVFFSLSGTKLPHYVLHGTTPLLILMAKYRADLRSRALTLIPALMFLGLVTFLPEAVRLAMEQQTDEYVRAMLAEASPLFTPGFRMTAIIALATVIGLVFARRLKPWQTLAFAGPIVVFVVAQLVFPAVGEVQQGPVRDAAHFAAEHNLDVVVWGVDNPSFSVYRRAETPRRLPQTGDIALTKVSRLDRIPDHDVLFQKGGIVLVHVLTPPEE